MKKLTASHPPARTTDAADCPALPIHVLPTRDDVRSHMLLGPGLVPARRGARRRRTSLGRRLAYRVATGRYPGRNCR